MSAIHERRYRLQREREIAQKRIKQTTLEYLERYETILNDVIQQGLFPYVQSDIQQIQAQLRDIRAESNRDAFQAREQSIQIGQRIYALPRLARQAAQVEAVNLEYERAEREREKQAQQLKAHEELQQAWQTVWLGWTDKYSRNLALKALGELKRRSFVQSSSYTVDQLQQEMLSIKKDAEQKSSLKRQAEQNDVQQEASKKMLEQLSKEVQEANLPVTETQSLTQDLTQILTQPHLIFTQVQDLIKKTDQALEDESIRREMVKAVYESLQHAGFSVLNPKRNNNEDEDVVVIQARRPSGNQAKFRIELDGKVRYEFDNYKGQSCKEDMVKVLPRLADVYGVNLSDEKVIWSNPDDEDQEMKPITPHNTQSR